MASILSNRRLIGGNVDRARIRGRIVDQDACAAVLVMLLPSTWVIAIVGAVSCAVLL